MSEVTTNEDLQALVLEWQKRLRLQDWDVTVKFTRAYDFYEPEVWKAGHIQYVLCHKYAHIVILDPADWERPSMIKFSADMVEPTVVHELLHLHCASFDKDETSDNTPIEQMINAVSYALMNAKYGR